MAYTYDSWGKQLSCTGTLANTLGAANPLRYRGYIYDSETGLYYLQSRYYNPDWGRFINGDNEIAGLSGGLLGNNVFSYCFNDPINYADSNGNWPRWITITIGAVVAVAAVALTVATMGAAAPAAICAASAMISSIGISAAAATTIATVGAAATITAASAYIGDIAYSSVTGESPLLEYGFHGNVEAYETGLFFTSIATAGFAELAYLGRQMGVCFTAGTPVLTSSGLVAIETIAVGDFVWAKNIETGELALKRVVQTFENETDELVHVFVGGEEIVTTPEHPFYVPQKGWTGAIHLRAGDVLVLVNGECVVVEKIQHEILESPIKVYNLEVEDFHTYFVGENSLLVHNRCKPISPVKVNKNVLTNVDVHAFKEEFVSQNISRWDVYKDTANNSALWLGNKTQTEWHETGYFIRDLLELFPK